MGNKSGKGSISEPCERVPSPWRGVQPRTEAGEPAELSEVRQPPSVRDWRRCGTPRPPGDWEVTARPDPLSGSEGRSAARCGFSHGASLSIRHSNAILLRPLLLLLNRFSPVRLCATPQMAAH